MRNVLNLQQLALIELNQALFTLKNLACICSIRKEKSVLFGDIQTLQANITKAIILLEKIGGNNE